MLGNSVNKFHIEIFYTKLQCKAVIVITFGLAQSNNIKRLVFLNKISNFILKKFHIVDLNYVSLTPDAS